MRKLAFAFALLILAIPCQARVITVDDDGPADFNNIQAGIKDANDGDTVVVSPGIYTGPDNRDIDFLGKAITVRSTDPNDPNVVAATIIDCNGTSGDKHRGFYFHSGEDADSILDGFTITNGYHHEGGGINCRESNPSITNCLISNNTADYGGGICCWGNSSPTISNCTISGNSAHLGGGIEGCGGPITNCLITGNTVEWGIGAGLHNCSGPISNCTITNNVGLHSIGGGLGSCDGPISNCTITGNMAKHGGGLFGCEGTITNCIITDNAAGLGGGGLWGCHGSIRNCIISGNSSRGYGGGVEWCNGSITNCNISGNWTQYGGGVSGSFGSISNCTITGNAASRRGGGFEWYNGPITNCIIWGNVARSGAQLLDSTDPNFSCIQDWAGGGEHNITADPCFVDLGTGYWDNNDTPDDIRDDIWVWTEGDYHLLEGSPCIDSGDPNFVPEPNETDLDGNARIVDGNEDGIPIVDMGAYEYRPPTPAELIAELLEEVGELGLPGGIENSLMAKLNAALRALEDENENNDAAAINTLEAFINAVETQRGKKIPEAEADALIAAAQEIIELLSDG